MPVRRSRDGGIWTWRKFECDLFDYTRRPYFAANSRGPTKRQRRKPEPFNEFPTAHTCYLDCPQTANSLPFGAALPSWLQTVSKSN